MRLILFGAALAMGVCSQPVAAEPDLVIAQEHAEILAEQVRSAFADHDRYAIYALAKWDGVREEHREIFRDFVAALVGQDIGGVFIGPLGDGHERFEYEGAQYAKNGVAAGQVTVSFVVEAPTVSEYLHWPYAVENGRAVILVDAPVAAE